MFWENTLNSLKVILSFLFFISLYSQTYHLRGLVVNKTSKEAIENVNVFIPGTRIGTVTNSSGEFSLKIAGRSGAQTITATISAKRRHFKNFNGQISLYDNDTAKVLIELREDIFLDDADIQSLFASEDLTKKQIPLTVDLITKEDIDKSHAENLTELFKIFFIGAYVDGSGGLVNAANHLNLRASSSFFGETQPSIYLDGVLMETNPTNGGIENGGFTLSRLNDIDIKSIDKIEILKGPVASTMYGSNAANGVIHIFTRVGLVNKLDLGVQTNVQSKSYDYDYPNSKVNLALDQSSGLLIDNSFNLSGGRQDHQYFLAVNLFENSGVVKSNVYKGFDFTSNINFNIGSALSIKTIAKFRKTRTDYGYSQNSTFGIYPFANLNGNDNNFTSRLDLYQKTSLHEDIFKFTGGIKVGYKLSDYSGISSIFGLDVTSQENDLSFKSLGINDEFYKRSDRLIIRNNVDINFFHKFEMDEDKHFDIFHIGFSHTNHLGNRSIKNTLGLTDPDISILKSNLGNIYDSDDFKSGNTAVYAHNIFNYYKKFHLFTGFRYETINFDNIENSIFLPQASANYIFSLGTGDYVKVIAGYGKTARNIQRNSYISYNQLNNNILNRSEVKPETVDEMEFGVESNLFTSTVRAKISYVQQIVNDAFVLESVSQGSTLESYLRNTGEIESSIIEFSLSGFVFRNKDFSFFTNLGFSAVTNEIIKANDSKDIMTGALSSNANGSSVYRVGQSTPVLYLPYITSTNPDGSINISSDRKVSGKVNPDMFGSMSNEFKFRNLSLRITTNFAFGHSKLNLSSKYLRYSGINSEAARVETEYNNILNNTSTLSASEQNEIRKTYQTNKELFLFEDVEKADWIKVKEISISYFLELRNSFFKSIKFSLAGRNLITSSDYSGLDPEVNSFYNGSLANNGIDFFSIPNPKSYSFKIQIDL